VEVLCQLNAISVDLPAFLDNALLRRSISRLWIFVYKVCLLSNLKASNYKKTSDPEELLGNPTLGRDP